MNQPQTPAQPLAGIGGERLRDGLTMGVQRERAGEGPDLLGINGALDDGSLFRLLDLAGPQIGRELLDRLICDLCNVEAGLVQARMQLEWLSLQGHSHVLISLAGAVGARRLQAQAEELNHLAHQIDHVAFAGTIQSALGHLNVLIATIKEVSRRYTGPLE